MGELGGSGKGSLIRELGKHGELGIGEIPGLHTVRLDRKAVQALPPSDITIQTLEEKHINPLDLTPEQFQLLKEEEEQLYHQQTDAGLAHNGYNESKYYGAHKALLDGMASMLARIYANMERGPEKTEAIQEYNNFHANRDRR
jgi:hypothetical protein